MQLIHGFEENAIALPAVATIGTFDGVHVGHQHLIRTIVSEARSRGAQAVVISFHPHPREVLGRGPGGGPMRYLTTLEEKAEQLALLNVDTFLVLPFTVETSQTPAAVFVDRLVRDLRLVSLWIGPDFALGYKRQGNLAFLREQGEQAGFVVNVIPELRFDSVAVSSTYIRELLAQGDVRTAALYLGRPFSITGRLTDEHTVWVERKHVLPAAGTYAVRVAGLRVAGLRVAGLPMEAVVPNVVLAPDQPSADVPIQLKPLSEAGIINFSDSPDTWIKLEFI